LFAQKRGAYIDYYDNLQHISSRLVKVSLTVLGVCLLLAAMMTLWTVRNTNRRIRQLAANARAVCHGEVDTIPGPIIVRDELDELAQCISSMTNRIVGVVSVGKVLEGAENERRRIAMDMHDQLLSDLTSIGRDMESLQHDLAQPSPEVLQRITHMQNALVHTTNTIREIIDDLHPRILDMLGLKAAIEAYVDKHSRTQGSPESYTSIDAQIDTVLTAPQRMHLYRIALEAINNTLIHSGCNRYEVTLRLANSCAILTVEDNGSGCDAVPSYSLDGHGLANIRERARALGAEVGWRGSRYSSGCCFELRIPLADK
jgi:signal transduction histidine kinase